MENLYHSLCRTGSTYMGTSILFYVFVVIVVSKVELKEVINSKHWQISCSIFPKIFVASDGCSYLWVTVRLRTCYKFTAINNIRYIQFMGIMKN